MRRKDGFDTRYRNNPPHDANYEDYTSYKPKSGDWSHEEVLERGQVVIEIKSRDSFKGGKQYSLNVGRKGRDEGFVMRYFQPRDLPDVISLCEEARDWIAGKQS
jgi:hypothetical protein